MTRNELEQLDLMIWQQLAAIPKGSLSSYGQIAKQCGYPGYARYVARVLKQLPQDSQLPWHRVVTAQNKIAFANGSDGFIRQKNRLQQEGFIVIDQQVKAVNPLSKTTKSAYK